MRPVIIAAVLLLAACAPQLDLEPLADHEPLPSLTPGTCLPRGEMLALLRHVGEEPAGSGIAPGGAIEITASAAGAWTALLSRPDGVSCVVDFGDGWRFLDMEGEVT